MFEIIFLSLAAVVSGCSTWELIAEFGRQKLDWLKKFFPFENGITSHDTLGRFFSIVNYVEFEKCFSVFIQDMATSPSRLVRIDGKTKHLRVATNKCDHLMHIVTAYCKENRRSIGQQVVDQKSNEIDEIPKLLDRLFLDNTIVSIDALGCQKKFAA